MNDRRNFLKMFGGGFGAAAALLAGRRLGAMGEELPSAEVPETALQTPQIQAPEGTLWATHEFKEPIVVNEGDALKITYRVTEKPLILRIAHDVSVWCRKGMVEPGEWFCHGEGSKKIDTVLGKTVVCSNIEFVGAKAMKWKQLKHGMMPIVVSTDPQSDEFRDCVDHANRGPMHGGDYALWGPVYKVWGAPGSQEITNHEFTEYELFCGNKSLRWFAEKELGHEGYDGLSMLKVKQMQSAGMGFTWYAPTLDIPGVTDRHEAKAAAFARAYGAQPQV